MTLSRSTRVALLCSLVIAVPTPRSEACHVPKQSEYLSAQQESLAAHGHGSQRFIAYSLQESTACADGVADIFPCENVDLLAHLPLDEIGGGRGNDIWGWRDGNREYALVGRTNGTAFVDMTDPENPVYLGNLPTQVRPSAWRDIKVYKNHAFIVADAAGNHGIQVFDLTQLRNVRNPPREFKPTARYDEFGSAHNIVINEDSGFAYAVGSDTCSGGLHMVDIRTPTRPRNAGCFSEDGYTHDAQCVTYRGPDRSYQGKEICFAANEDSITIVDVTDKSDPVMVSRNTYSGSAYTHQGWLTEDHAYFVVDDELDEQRFDHNAKTYVWDMSNLENPQITGAHLSIKRSIDHNQYVAGSYTYQANYQQGLTILEIVDPKTGKLERAGSFDTYPESDLARFDGAWSVYPYLKSGAVLISDINRGLFIVRPRMSAALFSDGFESGRLDAWSKIKGPGVSVVSPGLKKSEFALEVTADGTDAVSQLVSLQPARETSLEVSFLLKPNGIDLAGQEVEVLRFATPNGKSVVSMSIEQRGKKYVVHLAAESDGELQPIGSAAIPRKRAVPLRIEWQQASVAGAEDGVVRLVKKRRNRIERETLDSTAVIDAIRLGLPSGSEGTNSSSFLVDDFLVAR